MAWVKFNVKLVKDGTSDLSTHLFDYFVSNHNVPPPFTFYGTYTCLLISEANSLLGKLR